MQFSDAVIEAAGAAVAGDDEKAHDELARAFDLLMDARNHVYSVDFYVVDVTLLAASTLGEPLRAKLAAGFPTSLLATGELIERMATRASGDTRRTAARDRSGHGVRVRRGVCTERPVAGKSPEAILADLVAGRETS